MIQLTFFAIITKKLVAVLSMVC